MAEPNSIHVLIIGAGSTGLLIGQGLKQAGISYKVYERTNEDAYNNHQRDWSMSLNWFNDYLETCLPPDIFADISSAQAAPGYELTHEQENFLPMYDATTGQLLVKVPTITSKRVTREKLRKLLRRGLHVEYGKKLVGIEDDNDKVTAVFEDGSRAVGDVLVGCDAANSYVRQYLLGEEKSALTDVPVISYNLTSRYTKDQALFLRDSLHPLLKVGFQFPLKSFFILPTMDITNSADPSTWLFQIYLDVWSDEEPPSTSQERLAHIKEIGKHYCEPFRSATQWLQEDTFVHRDKIRHWLNPTKWDNHGGRITLAGDAAHAMAPYRGQGLNNALLDAHQYIQALTKATKADYVLLKDAIDAYDAEVFTRGAAEIEIGAKQAYASHFLEPFLKSPMAKFGTQRFMQMKEDAAPQS